LGLIVADLQHLVTRAPHVLAVAVAIALAACGSETPTGPSAPAGTGGSATATGVAVTCTTSPTGHQCQASAQLANGTSQDVTAAATWTSSNAVVATVDAAGRVTHIGSGQAEIRATYQDHFGGAIILVNVTVTTVTVTCTPETGAHVCTAIARLSNGVTQDVTRSGASWSSSNPTIAPVDSTGRVTHLGNGQVEIAARFQSVVGGMVLTLSGVVTVTSVSVTCTPQFEAHQCAAVANSSDGSNQTVTSQATWTSSNAAVATVDNRGYVRHRSSGQVEIQAAYRTVTGSIGLEIVVGSGASVVINEFSLRSYWGQVDDYVELRNDSPVAVDIGGWQIREWRANGSIEVRATVGSGVVLMPGCHYLAGGLNANLGGVARDVSLSDLQGNGGIALVRADGAIVDQVGLNPNSPFKEGVTLPPTTADDSPAWTRGGNDTNDNASDFLRRYTRTPLNSTSSCAVR
jgi:uncharacterized protein YjdB